MAERRFDPLNAWCAVTAGALIPVFALVVGGMTVLPDAIAEFSRTVDGGTEGRSWVPLGAIVGAGAVGGLVGFFWYAATHRP